MHIYTGMDKVLPAQVISTTISAEIQLESVMAVITIYSTSTCPICDKTKALFKKWGLDYDEVRVDQDPAGLKEMLSITNHARTVPQIVVQGKWIGSFTELTELHMDGELDELIAAARG